MSSPSHALPFVHRRKGSAPTPSADDEPAVERALTRHYVGESLFTGTAAAAASMMAVGVFVHINLHRIAGICMFLVGSALMFFEVGVGVAWQADEAGSARRLLELRRASTIGKFIAFAAFASLSIWAAVLMIQNTSS